MYIFLKMKNIGSNILPTYFERSLLLILQNIIHILHIHILQKIVKGNALVPIQFTNQTNERRRD